MNSKLLPVLFAVAALLGPANGAFGYAFMLDDTGCVSTWPAGTISMQVKLATTPTLTDGSSYRSSVLAAMNEWNAVTGTVQLAGTGVAPGNYALGNGTNEIVMDDEIGMGTDAEPFDQYTLAVTINYIDGNFFTESDIVFNTAYQWDSFRGSQIGSKQDIRRVAGHELGHVLGLDHPDEASPTQYVTALMNSTVSYWPSIEGPQTDDIDGVQSNYGYPGFVPANDNFSQAISIDLGSAFTTDSGTNVAATKETGEPNLDADYPGGRTVWWKWTASSGGTLTITTLGSNFDTMLGAYIGTAVNALTQLALNDDVESGVQRQSTITINVDPGTIYYFAVDGWGGVVGSIQLNFSLEGVPNVVPQILTSVLPRGVAGWNYSLSLEGTGGDGALVWSVDSGNLPAGLQLSADGAISGVPSAAGTSSFTVRLMDGDQYTGPSDEDFREFTITVDAEDSLPAITTTSLPDAGLSLAYSRSLAGTGGNGSLTWSLASGSLPQGLTLSEGGLISGIPTALGTRTFTVRVADDDTITGTADEATKELSITVVPAPRLTNVSMRAFAGAGDDTLIIGFYITGTGQKTVLIRGVGPKLLDYGVSSVVADPSITLYKDETVLETNNDWDSLLESVFLDAGAFALDFGSKDAALTATLEPGGYTIHLVNNGSVAEALVEVYDISRDAGSRLVNVSSRLRIQSGQVAILGTAVTGGSINVLARNVGPGIADYLTDPLDALPDPHLRLYSDQTEIATNDDWDSELLPYFGAAGAFTLEEGSKDAAIRAQFEIGGYTAHSTGNDGEGVALIEIYESP